ncbi:hypothetical protein WMY93_032058, partial [Mugilogobius chulae]
VELCTKTNKEFLKLVALIEMIKKLNFASQMATFTKIGITRGNLSLTNQEAKFKGKFTNIFTDLGPPCGPICTNEAVEKLLKDTKSEISTLKEKLNTRGDAVAKAAKSPHVGDYRELVHQLDQFLYCELRLIVLEIRNIYAVLFDIITKNYVKIKKPKGDGKAPIY